MGKSLVTMNKPVENYTNERVIKLNEFNETGSKQKTYFISFYKFCVTVQEFLDLDFVTARVPDYIPLRLFWVYLTGIVMIVTSLSVILDKKAKLMTIALGMFLLIINLLNYGYLLGNDFYNPVLWTGAMLNLAITAGLFILANTLSIKDERNKDSDLQFKS